MKAPGFPGPVKPYARGEVPPAMGCHGESIQDRAWLGLIFPYTPRRVGIRPSLIRFHHPSNPLTLAAISPNWDLSYPNLPPKQSRFNAWRLVSMIDYEAHNNDSDGVQFKI
jgi:hypothetical protein